MLKRKRIKKSQIDKTRFCQICKHYEPKLLKCRKSNLNLIASYLKFENCYLNLTWLQKLIVKIYSQFLTLE